MREPFSSLLASPAGKLALSLLIAAPRLIPGSSAFTFAPIPDPGLSIANLGRVAFVGDFDSISIAQFVNQTQDPPAAGNIYSRFPNGVFARIQDADGDVKAMCTYQKDGNVQGLVVGGNFTSVDGTSTPGGIAIINPNDGTVTAVQGLTGSVNALHCDAGRGQVYVGGSFTGSNSKNAIIWNGNWTDMPFQGFNKPVHSIVAGLNDNVIFGGEFTGLGGGNNVSGAAENNTQPIPVGSANLTAQTSSGRPGFTDPKNIACKGENANTQGPDATWLLADNAPGFWQADFGFGFQPTKLQLFNTDFEGRGTKTWRYTALPDGGIMNFTFTNPATGRQEFCDARCPLPQGNTTAQDFFFVNKVGMNAFRIDISEFYGAGGGLNAVQVFATDVFSYAINEFNQPQCGGVPGAGSATKTGPWLVTPSHNSNSQYLTATLQTNNIDPNSTFVVFQPDIPQSGNYSIKMYTPGCQGDGTCGTRGRISVTSSVKNDARPSSVEFFQTNEFDKYDEIYNGFVDATDGFRPSVTLAPVAGQDPGTGILTVVAQRVGFEVLNASSGELNGLFEYNPNQQQVDQDLAKSPINSAGTNLEPSGGAIVNALATADNKLFIGGNFSSDGGLNNLFAFPKDAQKPTPLDGNGLNGQVHVLYAVGDTVYVGGRFTDLKNGGNSALSGIASYSSNNWQALGAGVDGVVTNIVPFTMNISSSTPEDVLDISGFFQQVKGFGDNGTFSVNNSAIWVPSRKNWLHNLNLHGLDVQGRLTAWADVPNADRVYGGAVSSQALTARGAAALQHGGSALALQSLPFNIQPQQQRSLQKRSLTEGQNLTTTGIITGIFDKANGANRTIVGGRFAIKGSDGQNITNVAIVDELDNNKVTGFTEAVDSNSTFAALSVRNNVLFAGGRVTGRIDNNRVAGIVAWDLSAGNFANTQPPALQGTNVTVNAIAHGDNTENVFVGGRFESAGALSCPGLCIWNAQRNQWNAPSADISGVVTSLVWITGTNKMLVSGNLTINNNRTSIFTYDSSSDQFQPVPGSGDLPGSVTALTPASRDGSQIWAAGQTPDGAAFLQRYDGSKWVPVNDQFGPSTDIRGIQIITVTDHDDSELVPKSQILLLLGSINTARSGDPSTASAVLFNGTSMTPFLLSTTAQNSPGSLSQIFVENPQSFFENDKKPLAVGFVVLIALAIALALTFLLVVAGILVEYYRKKSQGYSLAPMSYTDRIGNVGRVPPEQLFGTLSGPRAPTI